MVMGTLTAAVPEIAIDDGIEHDVAIPTLGKPHRRSTVPVKPPGAGVIVSVDVAFAPATIAGTLERDRLMNGAGATETPPELLEYRASPA
jgi:hypothetical protein